MGDFTGEKKKKQKNAKLKVLRKEDEEKNVFPRGYEASQRLGLKPSAHCERTGATWEKCGLN